MIHYDGKLENFISPEEFVKKFGVGEGGYIQEIVDAAVIKACSPYVPYAEGALEGSASNATKIGSGEIIYDTPYARYLYYGEVYGPNIPIVENGDITGYWSPPEKFPTGKKLEYSTEHREQAGSRWFDRAMADHTNDILKEAQDAIDRRRTP